MDKRHPIQGAARRFPMFHRAGCDAASLWLQSYPLSMGEFRDLRYRNLIAGLGYLDEPEARREAFDQAFAAGIASAIAQPPAETPRINAPRLSAPARCSQSTAEMALQRAHLVFALLEQAVQTDNPEKLGASNLIKTGQDICRSHFERAKAGGASIRFTGANHV
jgi:hypothetical protein